MDAETAILLGGAFLLSAAVAVQHFYDRFHPRGLYKSAVQRTAALPPQIGIEVENALNRVSERQRAQYEADAAKALEAAQAQGKSIDMSMVRAVGVDQQSQEKATRIMAEGLLGQWLPALRVALPSVAEQLEENPELIFSIIENPFFKKHIAPRIQAMLGSEGGSNSTFAVSTGGGWR